ncbi:unnamed protein product [Clonostachys rosea]|uniref:Carbohydrate kinase PfkB domain-containing protein n=1 Tax=Bionectria ochroleuca TaxID=29856 RepID=A0ABY6U9I5_BIOOC|nr:unnamed protein product [Clonostachys rosea]
MAILSRVAEVSNALPRHLVKRGFLQQRNFTLSARQYSQASLRGLGSVLRVSEEVRDAIATNKPVVALESTIYTHGAIGDLGVEDIVRRNGGVPAVCGILAGVPTVGLLPHEIDRMIEEKAHKVSRKDIASIVGKGFLGIKEHGGTTISGTMILAQLAGIRVFATGGLGGVHRGAEDSMDISADLTELGRTRVAVVASGSKGFLDIKRTLEFLETQGVTVSTFLCGRSPDQVTFPGFWATNSGYKTPHTMKDEETAAALILAQERMQIETGLLLANPVPDEYSIPTSETDAIVEQAVAESHEKGISGNQNSPFILQRIKELSQGRSVTANLALVQSNAECATKVAAHLCRMLARGNDARTTFCIPLSQADILVAGSVALDLHCDYAGAGKEHALQPSLYTSNPGHISQCIGGVGRNVALAAHRVNPGAGVRLLSVVGDDMAGNSIISSLASLGMDVSCVDKFDKPSSGGVTRTAEYIAVNGADKNLFLALADMHIFDSNTHSKGWGRIVAQSQPKWLVVDANWNSSDIIDMTKIAKSYNARVAFEPVSQIKSERLFDEGNGLQTFPQSSVDLSTPNEYELGSMHQAAKKNGHFGRRQWSSIHAAIRTLDLENHLSAVASEHQFDVAALHQIIELLPFIPNLITKLGSRGVIVAQLLSHDDPKLVDQAEGQYVFQPSSKHHDIGGVLFKFYPPMENVDDVVSVNGAGDTFLGVLVAGLACGGKIENLVDIAQRGAIMTIRTSESVSPLLSSLRSDLLRAASK